LIDENIILEPEYIEALRRQDIAVAVPEGSGYLGTLNVYRELHCLKTICETTRVGNCCLLVLR
jgi:hypothetical protein